MSSVEVGAITEATQESEFDASRLNVCRYGSDSVVIRRSRLVETLVKSTKGVAGK